MSELNAVAAPTRRQSTPPTTDEVLQYIDRILRDEVGLERGVQPETLFNEELALDSLGTFSLIVALEDRFQITLPDQFADEVRTVADLAALVVRQRSEEAP
jgi:acyl carrier protein